MTVFFTSWRRGAVSFDALSKPLVFTALLSFVSLMAVGPVAAQQANNNNQRTDVYEDTKERIKAKKVREGDLDTLGYKIADGVLLLPEIRIEGGYDSNHDEFLSPIGSGYGLVDGSLLFGFIQADQAVTLTFKGSYDKLSRLRREDRWDAGVNLDSYFRLSPNWEYSGGLFYLRDEISLSRNQTYSSHSQLNYTSQMLEGYLRSESYILNYLGSGADLSGVAAAQRPFFRDNSFDMRRHEGRGGIIFGPNSLVGVYGTAGVGVSNYTNQPDESQLDRDAVDLWVSSGFRFNFSPSLRAELGWRFNERDLEDRTVGSYSSDGFDAKVTWEPNELLSIIYEADTFLAEPSAAFSRVGDRRRHSLTATIQPTVRSQIDLFASHEIRKEIGTEFKYTEERLGAEYSYTFRPNEQFYLTTSYINTVESCDCLDYSRTTIGVGYRRAFVRHPGDLPPEENLGGDILPGLSLIETRVGYSKLFLPETRMLAITNAANNAVIRQGEDHNGEVEGARVDVRVPGFADIEGGPFLELLGLGSQDLSFNLAGYYGRYDTTQHTSCDSSAIVGNCIYFNIFDSVPGDVNSFTTGSITRTKTNRTVDAWGIAIETQFDENEASSPAGLISGAPFRVGLAIKALQQETHLSVYETNGSETVDYNEDLDTFYYGGYISFLRTLDLGAGTSLGLNAEAGAYFANAKYKGRYDGFLQCGACGSAIDRATEKDSHRDFSFIGSVRLDLNREFAWGTIGLFAEGEYYSFVPEMLYNNNDSGAGPDITGPHVGTSIGEGDAYSYSVGARMNVPLN